MPTETSLGIVETRSFPIVVKVADIMLKSSGVTLVGFEKIHSGYCSAVVRGRIADVRLAVEAGAEEASKSDQLISKIVLPRPLPNLEAVFPISTRLARLAQNRGYSRVSNQAVGLVETRGFPAMVGASDAMLKNAEVELVAYETIGDGLCTAIVRGSVADVLLAVDAGMYEAGRIGELHAVMVIPRPLDDLEQALPVASCYISQPVALPMAIPDMQPQEIPRSESDRLPIFIEEIPPGDER